MSWTTASALAGCSAYVDCGVSADPRACACWCALAGNYKEALASWRVTLVVFSDADNAPGWDGMQADVVENVARYVNHMTNDSAVVVVDLPSNPVAHKSLAATGPINVLVATNMTTLGKTVELWSLHEHADYGKITVKSLITATMLLRTWLQPFPELAALARAMTRACMTSSPGRSQEAAAAVMARRFSGWQGGA